MAKDSTATFATDCKANIYFAPTGTALPADTDVAIGAAWLNIGYLLDPPDFSRDVKTNSEKPWNACSPIRELVEEENIEVTMKFEQISKLTDELYWGGGTWTNPTATSTVFVPAGGVAERGMIIQVFDGTNELRFCFEKVGVTKVGKLGLVKAKLSYREITLKRLVGPSSPNDFKIEYNWAVPTA